ncbi:AraC family transcriptional regulator [Sphingosinicella sp. LHD-64]|uniref:AraC family transcriptional regulator n=1 Tax=Sphingosinicella sp. LHD-64 TaxID=3072139 RepID=UPI00280E6EA0|nr:AraC family transcriptional regulator [Sphingosinicella sp. LHD-64]MDQ8756194.1 AraC family transcriptional regulator [Sphingosinicella sp. LHD-64]
MRQAASSVRFSKPTALPGIELVSVAYPERAFPPHSHPEFVIGVVIGGAETLQVGRQVSLAPSGTTLLLHPDEVHANSSIGPEPLRYRVMYVPRETMSAWLPETLTFPSPVSRAPSLFDAVLRSHRILDRPNDRLTQEAAFAALLDELAKGADLAERTSDGKTHCGVARVRDFIDECSAGDFSLDDLAALAGLSRFHFLRIFKQATGLTPVAYRNQRRVEAARRLLRGGLPIAEIALATGFADQSHLTRQFQRLVGTSPARYRQQ